jgi:hypothetical protein
MKSKFSIRKKPPVEESYGATNQRVPHISLVFREMWDTTAADLHPSALQELPIEVRGLPYLARFSRDMGHPLIRGRDRNLTGRFSRKHFSPCNLQIAGAKAQIILE